MKEPRTLSKTIRLTREELDHAGKLLPQFPECMSEADLLRQATLIGLYVLASQATGTPAYGGYQVDDLVALLKYRVLPTIDFLFEHDAYPVLYRSGQVLGTEVVATQRPDDAATTHMAAAADELAGLGIDFME